MVYIDTLEKNMFTIHSKHQINGKKPVFAASPPIYLT